MNCHKRNTRNKTASRNSGRGLAAPTDKGGSLPKNRRTIFVGCTTKNYPEGGLRIENTIMKQVASHQPQSAPQKQPHLFRKRIGSTFYKVAVYHSDTSKENIEDKILRLAKNDAINIAITTNAKGVVSQ
jgi:hypothetical protein